MKKIGLKNIKAGVDTISEEGKEKKACLERQESPYRHHKSLLESTIRTKKKETPNVNFPLDFSPFAKGISNFTGNRQEFLITKLLENSASISGERERREEPFRLPKFRPRSFSYFHSATFYFRPVRESQL